MYNMIANHSKLPDIETTIFTVMSQLAAECNAINLSQGFPDFSAPDELLDRVTHYLKAGDNQYAPMAGVPRLLHQVSEKISRLYQRPVDPLKEITVTSGATQALYCAIQAFVHPGDEVIVFDPAYDSYDPAVRLAGGTCRHIRLNTPDFSIDWNQVETAINSRTRMIILNSPHNPTGAILNADDMESLALLVRDTPIVLLGDEVYEHIVFDGHIHHSLLRYPELADRSLVISSFGKTCHTTGWKIGYCVAPEKLMREFRRVHQFVQFCVVTPMQLALADFLESTPQHYLGLSEFYQKKRDHFISVMQSSRFRMTPAGGTYFQLADYSALSQKTDTDYTRQLTQDIGVACIPISVFYKEPPDDQHLIRFCFAKSESTLSRAAEILCAI